MPSTIVAKVPEISSKDLLTPLPRIIRTCCSFGYDVGIVGIPGASVTDVTELHLLGQHTFLGSREEGNGIIYTKRGGFIDIGHVRDLADWTAYLYVSFLAEKTAGSYQMELGHEGGVKSLEAQFPEYLNDSDVLVLAGRVAYDLAVWHEIATWFGVSYIPFIPERYSSFSIEDNYSNLMGILLGMEAIKSELPFEDAMTLLLNEKLLQLEVVKDVEQTIAAMEKVEGIWWTNEKKLPNEDVLLNRNLDAYYKLRPWIVHDEATSNLEILEVPKTTISGMELSRFYELSIDLNYKFPVRKIFPEREDRVVTQDDFMDLIYWVAREWLEDESKKVTNEKALDRQMRRRRITDPESINHSET